MFGREATFAQDGMLSNYDILFDGVFNEKMISESVTKITFRVKNTGDRIMKVSPPVVRPFEDEYPVMYPVLRGKGAREIFLRKGEY